MHKDTKRRTQSTMNGDKASCCRYVDIFVRFCCCCTYLYNYCSLVDYMFSISLCYIVVYIIGFLLP